MMNFDTFALQLYHIGIVQFGQFRLKSGIESPIYIDLRRSVSHPQLLQGIVDLLAKKMSVLDFDILCGVPYTAIPFATALSLQHTIPMVMRRKEAKEYGTKRLIEGCYEKGQRCLIIDDLITSGKSLMETIDPLEKEGLEVRDTLVFLDREQGGSSFLESQGYHLHSACTLSELLDSLQRQSMLQTETFIQVQNFLDTHQVGV